MALIGRDWRPVDLPDTARPTRRLDGDTAPDLRAQRDAAVGWVAVLLAHQRVGPDATAAQRRDAEHDAAVHVRARVAAPHDYDDHIDTCRLIAVRAEETT